MAPVTTSDQLGAAAFEHLDDTFGSFPMIRRYTPICLLFSLPEDVPSIQTEVEQHLRRALAKLARDLPWVAGRVIYEGRDETHSGIRRVIPHADEIELIVKYSTAELPSFQEMQIANFPMRFLQTDVVVPPIAVTWVASPYDNDIIAPVLVLQANFVRGGLVLTIASNHTTMDMTGLGMLIGFFAKACRGEDLTSDEIAQANQDRRNVIPLLGDDYQPGPELDDCFIPQMPPPPPPTTTPPSTTTTTATPPKPAKWAYFNFPQQALKDLKLEASKQTIVPYISTDDAVTALCWQRTQAARAAKLGPKASSTLARLLSMRHLLGLSGPGKYYMGHLADCGYAEQTDVFALPVGDVAGRLRAVLRDEEAQRRHFCAFATMVHRLDDKSVLANGARQDPHSGVGVSSYVNVKTGGMSFGDVLGRPVATRRPMMAPWPSLMYLMPLDAKGDMAVGFCLAEDEIETLRGDQVLGRYATYVG
ncbi:trichothecene 3-O-acetyltransferase [Pyricularia oryzae 70-15]|uniref:Trichothecene 3-O-acetyltransferase n=3 Tax=Pyricularia oryzae TaxID=318829 RepID=G4NA71_PYRO7|nr:trichothecene 3-O-acetyltransferase [Pyricularia oryzae 70-15]EHA49621.1 trichothecene 3-O-acetyltransferase [Pyricularia oryzae 70-15]ELQ41193.1 trichothecene 3-O-acetyltransferase [Pyricularia oryzae Y34]KAI7910457.1 trichothecene 3-O-acetyltransferase [Pyricularia oryzae]KAI7910797.1 trichothecene 3-O-acetyltransferase [Pyricularia oryzae]